MRSVQTDFHTGGRPFGIKLEDRRPHTYLVGKTGTGKSTLIKNMVLQDIAHGHALALAPHGDLVERVLDLNPWRSACSDSILQHP